MTGKTISLTLQTFVGKVMSLLFNTLSRFVIAFLSRSKCLLISWLQSLSAVIFLLSVFKCCHPLILLLKDKFLLSWRCSPFLWNVCWFQKKFIPYAYWSIIHLKLVVMYGIKSRSKFFSFFFTSYMNSQLTEKHLLKK